MIAIKITRYIIFLGETLMRLLLIEDDLKLGIVQKELLELAGFEVVWATDGRQALEDFLLAKDNTFDVIILDWMLPEISGLEVCKILRSPKYNYQGGIIFVTAKDSLDDCLQGLEAGADDYLVKPFANKELVARIKALGRRKVRPYVDSIYQKNTVSIDNNLLKVTLGSKSLQLTKREFELFSLLFINQGHIIPRSAILEKVWTNNLDISESNLDSYIYLLRKKLSFFGDTMIIKSVKNVGYILEINNHD